MHVVLCCGAVHAAVYVWSIQCGPMSDAMSRFNKIAVPNNKFQMASGQGSHWLIESPTIFSSMCSPLKIV